MKRHAVRLAIAIATFSIGVAGVWIAFHRPRAQRSVPVSFASADPLASLPSGPKLQKVGDLPAPLTDDSVISLQFVDARTGWISIDGKLWRTDDGGAKWRQLIFPWMEKRYNDYDYSLGGFQFVNATDGWLISDNQLYRTDDGGYTWRMMKQPFHQFFSDESEPEGLSGFAFHKDGKHGWITGERFRPLTPDERKMGELNHQTYTPDRKQVLASFIYFTSDGGRTWSFQPVQRDPNRLYNAGYILVPIDNQHALASGMGGIYYLDHGKWLPAEAAEVAGGAVNHGECLSTAYGGPSFGPTSAFFVDSHVGWLLNSNGFLCKTDDAGKTWTDSSGSLNVNGFELGFNMWGTKVHFFDMSRGVGLDADGNLRFSSDGGESWKLVNGGAFQELFALDAQHGWVVSSQGIFRIPSADRPD